MGNCSIPIKFVTCKIFGVENENCQLKSKLHKRYDIGATSTEDIIINGPQKNNVNVILQKQTVNIIEMNASYFKLYIYYLENVVMLPFFLIR